MTTHYIPVMRVLVVNAKSNHINRLLFKNVLSLFTSSPAIFTGLNVQSGVSLK